VVSSKIRRASQPWGHVRGVDVAHPVAAELDHLAVLEGYRRPVGHVVERHHATEGAVGDLGAGRSGEELVHRAALVGLDVAEGDPAQVLERHQRADRLGHQWKQLAVTGVKQHRLLVADQELVERHACGPDVGDVGGEPERVRCDLVDGGVHGGPPHSMRIARRPATYQR
jgi:hypothetical protein